MSAPHYRALSVTSLVDPSSRPSIDAGLTRRSSVDNGKRASVQGAYQSHAGLLDDPQARARFSSLPRNYRRLRLSAYLGWAVATILLIALAVSQSPASNDLRQLGPLGAMRSSAWRSSASAMRGKVGAASAGRLSKPTGSAAALDASMHASAAPASIASPVTIVSSFYRVDSGKKHRVSGTSPAISAGLGIKPLNLPVRGGQSTTSGWATSSVPSSSPSSSTARHRSLRTSRTCEATRCAFSCARSLNERGRDEDPAERLVASSQPLTLVTDFSSPFDMPPVQDLGGHEWAVQQHKMDPEQHVHVPDVYGVWTAKPWIVKDAAKRNPYGSDYFFWVR